MRRPFSALVAVTLAAGCSDQPPNDQPLLGPTLSTMAPATTEVDAPRAPLHASGGVSDLAVGISSIDPGVQMFWDPGKAAFRAGRATGTEWDDTNVGPYSVAMGRGTTASGGASTALGANTTATGDTATAMGWNSRAEGNFSTAMGYNTAARASGSTAMGSSTTANGNSSTAMGFYTTASGDASTATGDHTTASGNWSAAMGFYTTASGSRSTAMGTSTTAQALASLVIGRANVIEGSPSSWVATDPLFVIGNGMNSAAPNNAFEVLKNGNTTVDGDLTVSGSYFQLPVSPSPPPAADCDEASERGRMMLFTRIVTPPASSLFVCTGFPGAPTWKSITL